MEKLHIESALRIPAIDFDPQVGKLNMSGKCFPENADKFFQPIFDWLHQYKGVSVEQTVVKIDLEYFNTQSSRCLFQMMDVLEEIQKLNKKVVVYWRMYEDGLNEADRLFEQRLMEMYPFIQFVYGEV